jgi:hypothetical protein
MSQVNLPAVKTTIALEGQQVTISAWGTVSEIPAKGFRLHLTTDLSDLQEHLTPLLSAQLNRYDRCGERLSVERAELAPKPPAGLLTVHVHYERWGCAKAFGKEMAKRLVGGNGVVEVLLTPSVDAGTVSVTSEVRKIDADGSLGEVLRSGSMGDSLREKIAASIRSAFQKSLNPKSALPPAVGDHLAIESAQFADGGAGHLWLTAAGDIRMSADEMHSLLGAAGR